MIIKNNVDYVNKVNIALHNSHKLTREGAIILEDSLSVIHSVVGLYTHNPDSFRENGAFMVISDLTDLKLWKCFK